jgi:hypothetical protein
MKEVKIEGFVTNPAATDSMALAVFGEQGSGKTRFGITFPGPIGVIPLDRKSRKTIEKIARELDKTVLLPKDDFIRVENPMKLSMLKADCEKTIIVSLDAKEPPKVSGNYCCAKHYYRWHVNRIKSAAFRLYAHPDIETIMIDTGTQLWEDILFAHYGRSERIMPRDRGPANQEMIDLLNCLSGKNLVITHKAKEIWKSDKPTGRYELAGFAHMGYHVNVVAEMVCDENKRPEDEGRFSMNVHLCQDNPDIQGPKGKRLLTDDTITYDYLTAYINGEMEVE